MEGWMDKGQMDRQNEHSKTGVISLCHQHSSLALRIMRGSKKSS